jgi:phage-related protein
MKKSFIAYQGEEFTIEWYYDSRGKSEVLDYFLSLPKERKEKLFYLLHMLADIGTIRNEEKFRYEGDKVYVFKPSPDRFFCFFYKNAKVIVVSAYEKKSVKMPAKEKVKALKLREDYMKRSKGETYYE